MGETWTLSEKIKIQDFAEDTVVGVKVPRCLYIAVLCDRQDIFELLVNEVEDL